MRSTICWGVWRVTVRPRAVYPRLGGVAEVAARAGRATTVVCSWADRAVRSFPLPIAALGAGRVWDMDEVDAWLARYPEMTVRGHRFDAEAAQ